MMKQVKGDAHSLRLKKTKCYVYTVSPAKPNLTQARGAWEFNYLTPYKMDWSQTDYDEQQADAFADMCYTKALNMEYRKQFYGLGELIEMA